MQLPSSFLPICLLLTFPPNEGAPCMASEHFSQWQAAAAEAIVFPHKAIGFYVL